jgi:tetratricopeptide (TPR) repeat protein
MNFFYWLIALILSFHMVAHAKSNFDNGSMCGNLKNPYGPFDYTNAAHRKEKLPIVEKFHFDLDVQSLRRGARGHYVEDDLDYVLRAFPNHHRALYAMARYQLRAKHRKPRHYSAECYFDRAIRFNPNDGIVYMIFGIYLHKKGKVNEAMKQYTKALKLIPESAELHYNMGLAQLDLNHYKNAELHAIEAYRLGYQLPGLKKKLIELGHWSGVRADTE